MKLKSNRNFPQVAFGEISSNILVSCALHKILQIFGWTAPNHSGKMACRSRNFDGFRLSSAYFAATFLKFSFVIAAEIAVWKKLRSFR